MSVAGWLRRYAAHPDPATAAANLVALVVAANGPCYPLYVLALIGWNHAGAWLSMLASPAFFLVPAIARRWPAAGRATLPLVGIANTVWCVVLFGTASGVGLFVLPCIALATLVCRAEERWLALLLLGLGIATFIMLTEFSLGGLLPVGAAAPALARLNAICVATLIGFVALTLIGVLREVGRRSVQF